MTCYRCRRRPATNARPSCEACRAYWREYQRIKRAAQPPLMPRPMTERVLILLSTFILTVPELSSALNISITHASVLLRRLWERGLCERWPHTGRSYRYALKGLL